MISSVLLRTTRTLSITSTKPSQINHAPIYLQILHEGDWNSAAHYLLLRGSGSSALECLWVSGCWTDRHKHSLSYGPLPLHGRHGVTESGLNTVFRVHNKPTAAVLTGAFMLTGPREEKALKNQAVASKCYKANEMTNVRFKDVNNS
jgi:hypothetical protein